MWLADANLKFCMFRLEASPLLILIPQQAWLSTDSSYDFS